MSRKELTSTVCLSTVFLFVAPLIFFVNRLTFRHVLLISLQIQIVNTLWPALVLLHLRQVQHKKRGEYENEKKNYEKNCRWGYGLIN